MEKDYQAMADQGKKWCYDCINYYTASFCGYDEAYCKIFGGIDPYHRTERHPDRTADSCPEYRNNGKPLWFKKYGL